MNPIANNPVITKDAATLAIFFVAWKLLGLSLGESAAIAGTFNAGASPFIRQLVTPVAKLDEPIAPPPPLPSKPGVRPAE